MNNDVVKYISATNILNHKLFFSKNICSTTTKQGIIKNNSFVSILVEVDLF